MRTREKPIDFDFIDVVEKTCQYLYCKIMKFYTDNIRAIYCCDEHRYKANQLKNKPRTDLMRDFNRNFLKNCLALKHLYLSGIVLPTKRDLKIAGFDIKHRTAEMKSEQGKAFIFDEYTLLVKTDNTYQIIKTTI